MKVTLIVAAFAIGAKVAIVRVITAVTVDALAGKFDFLRYLFSMTCFALKALVSAFQFKITDVVIKLPKLPAVGVVALCTILP